ncbi:hypothetical protein H6F50_25505 [Coleofasciculus sp. FACHB-712]|uniref:hypothetical protein n=1 Tax=Cyanophyceae TaxID=3028117 RepID=UPI0016825A3C|nr:hypothetical protein [Coleofasciculus sp. FACHB-712]MBD1945668.1 hypothetical protein [Coleofasciculus sp. FACHB-712]
MKKTLLSIVTLTAVGISQGGISKVWAGELVYKMRLRDTVTEYKNPSEIDEYKKEWAVVNIIDGKKIKIRHTTHIQNKAFPVNRWFDHPASAIRICLADDFEQRNCRSTSGDIATLPTGKSIHDLVIDFRYSEAGTVYTRSIQITPDMKPKSR